LDIVEQGCILRSSCSWVWHARS